MNFIVLESNQFETHIFPSASHTLTYLESMDLFEHRVPLDPLIDHYVSYLEWPFGGLTQMGLCIGKL